MTWQKFLGLRQFWEEDAIRALVDRTMEQTTAGSLLIFETRKQRTWLVCTRDKLICVLDDLRRPEPNIQWQMSREDLLDGSQLKIDIREEPYSDRSGKLHIGPSHRGWLFSRRLFGPDGSPIESVRKLITNAMNLSAEAAISR